MFNKTGRARTSSDVANSPKQSPLLINRSQLEAGESGSKHQVFDDSISKRDRAAIIDLLTKERDEALVVCEAIHKIKGKKKKRILIVSQFRILLCRHSGTLSSVTVLENQHLFDLRVIKSYSKRQLELKFVKAALDIEFSNDRADEIITLLRLAEEIMFPGKVHNELIQIDVKPSTRVRYMLPQEEDGPCAGFASTYRAALEYFRAPFGLQEEETLWIVNNLIESNGRVDLHSSDFMELPTWTTEQMQAFLLALAYNLHFVSLSIRDIRFFREAQAHQLADILKHNRALHTLDLHNVGLTPTGASAAFAAAARRKHPWSLVSIDVSGNNIEDRGLVSLAGALRRNPALARLDVSRCSGREKATAELLRGLAEAASLMNPNNAVPKTDVIQAELTLEYLDVSGNRLARMGSVALAHLLSCRQGFFLRTLHLQACHAQIETIASALYAQEAPALEELDLSYNAVSAKGAGLIVSLVHRRLNKLHALDLSGTSFPFVKLAELMCVMPRGSFLAARDNNYTESSISSVPLFLAPNATGKAADERTSNMPHSPAAIAVSGARCKVGELDLSQNPLGDLGTAALARLVLAMPNLRGLVMQDTFRRPTRDRQAAIAALAQVIATSQTLSSLDVSFTGAVSASSRSVAGPPRPLRIDGYPLLSALSTSSIEHISFAGHEFGNRGACLLGQSLQLNRSLLSIDFDRNQVGFEGFRHFAASLAYNTHLREMSWPLVDIADCVRHVGASGMPESSGGGLGAIPAAAGFVLQNTLRNRVSAVMGSPGANVPPVPHGSGPVTLSQIMARIQHKLAANIAAAREETAGLTEDAAAASGAPLTIASKGIDLPRSRPSRRMPKVFGAPLQIAFTAQAPIAFNRPPSVGRRGGAAEEMLRSKGSGVQLPGFLSWLITFLSNERCLVVEGLFRVSPSADSIAKLQERIDAGEWEVLKLQAPEDAHLAAGVLKLFLRSMPEPLCTNNLFAQFAQVIKDRETAVAAEADNSVTPEIEDGMLQHLSQVLAKLPTENRILFRHIIRLLRRVADFEESNRMSPYNLGVVFGPTLFRTPATVTSSAITVSNVGSDLVEFMITKSKDIYASLPSSLFSATRIATYDPTRLAALANNVREMRRQERAEQAGGEDSAPLAEPSNALSLPQVPEDVVGEESDDEETDADAQVAEADADADAVAVAVADAESASDAEAATADVEVGSGADARIPAEEITAESNQANDLRSSDDGEIVYDVNDDDSDDLPEVIVDDGEEGAVVDELVGPQYIEVSDAESGETPPPQYWSDEDDEDDDVADGVEQQDGVVAEAAPAAPIAHSDSTQFLPMRSDSVTAFATSSTGKLSSTEYEAPPTTASTGPQGTSEEVLPSAVDSAEIARPHAAETHQLPAPPPPLQSTSIPPPEVIQLRVYVPHSRFVKGKKVTCIPETRIAAVIESLYEWLCAKDTDAYGRKYGLVYHGFTLSPADQIGNFINVPEAELDMIPLGMCPSSSPPSSAHTTLSTPPPPPPVSSSQHTTLSTPPPPSSTNTTLSTPPPPPPPDDEEEEHWNCRNCSCENEESSEMCSSCQMPRREAPVSQSRSSIGAAHRVSSQVDDSSAAPPSITRDVSQPLPPPARPARPSLTTAQHRQHPPPPPHSAPPGARMLPRGRMHPPSATRRVAGRGVARGGRPGAPQHGRRPPPRGGAFRHAPRGRGGIRSLNSSLNSVNTSQSSIGMQSPELPVVPIRGSQRLNSSIPSMAPPPPPADDESGEDDVDVPADIPTLPEGLLAAGGVSDQGIENVEGFSPRSSDS